MSDGKEKTEVWDASRTCTASHEQRTMILVFELWLIHFSPFFRVYRILQSSFFSNPQEA